MTSTKSPLSPTILLSETRGQILSFCQHLGRPVTIGEVATLLGWKTTLEAAEGILDEMVKDGLLVKRTSKGERVIWYDRCT